MSIAFNGTTFTGTNANHQVNFNGATMCTVADASCNIVFDHQTVCRTNGGGWQCICPLNSTMYSCNFFMACAPLNNINCWRVLSGYNFTGYFSIFCLNTTCRTNPQRAVITYGHTYPYAGMRCSCISPTYCNCLFFSNAVNFSSCCGISSMQLGNPSGYSINATWRQSSFGTQCVSLAANTNSSCIDLNVCTCPISCARLRISCGNQNYQYVEVGCIFSACNLYWMVLPTTISTWGGFLTQSCILARGNCCQNFLVSGSISCVPGQAVPSMCFWDAIARNNCTCQCIGYLAWYNAYRNVNVSRGTGDLYRAQGSWTFGTCPKGGNWSAFNTSSGTSCCVGV